MEQLIILIDSREQSPFLFKNQPDILVAHGKLETGDYSVKGWEHNGICVERKNALDFLGSISNDRDRFKRELERMSVYERKCIVVETTLKECMDGIEVRKGRAKKGHVCPTVTSKVGIHPNALFGSVVAIYAKYQVPIFFMETRARAEEFTLKVLRKYFEYKRNGEIA